MIKTKHFTKTLTDNSKVHGINLIVNKNITIQFDAYNMLDAYTIDKKLKEINDLIIDINVKE